MAKLSYISRKARVKKSSIHGKGLFAIEAIDKGEIVCVKGGYVFNQNALKRLQKSVGPAEIQIADQLYIGTTAKDENAGGMIFSNHSCNPNIGVQGQIVFVAMREIAAGEELTHDWAMTDDDTFETKCNCGASNCRGVITGKDWMKKDLQRKYKKYMSWYLQEKIKRHASVGKE
jgi:SET domain-containing protein